MIDWLQEAKRKTRKKSLISDERKYVKHPSIPTDNKLWSMYSLSPSNNDLNHLDENSSKMYQFYKYLLTIISRVMRMRYGRIGRSEFINNDGCSGGWCGIRIDWTCTSNGRFININRTCILRFLIFTRRAKTFFKWWHPLMMIIIIIM